MHLLLLYVFAKFIDFCHTFVLIRDEPFFYFLSFCFEWNAWCDRWGESERLECNWNVLHSLRAPRFMRFALISISIDISLRNAFELVFSHKTLTTNWTDCEAATRFRRQWSLLSGSFGCMGYHKISYTKIQDTPSPNHSQDLLVRDSWTTRKLCTHFKWTFNGWLWMATDRRTTFVRIHFPFAFVLSYANKMRKIFTSGCALSIFFTIPGTWWCLIMCVYVSCVFVRLQSYHIWHCLRVCATDDGKSKTTQIVIFFLPFWFAFVHGTN